MCYDHDAAPPIAAISGAAITGRARILTADDGTEFAAYEAKGPGANGPAVVILPDVRGLHAFYRDLADRFAERGIDAVAVDYFGRTAGVGERGDDFDYMPHVDRVTAGGVLADCRAAVEHLRSGDPERPVFTVGFCFGGSNAWQQAANGLGLAGAVGFYGRPTGTRPSGAPSVLDRVSQMDCPILALMGGDDPGIPLDEVEQFRDALAAAGVPHEVVVYDGAPHSFFDRRQHDFAEASADAWRRVLAFIETHGTTGG